MISVKEAREILGPNYDKFSDKQIEKLIINYSSLVSSTVDMVLEEHIKEENKENID